MKKIFGGRSGLLGDTITCLPLIHVLKKMHGEDCQIHWAIAPKCRQASPLYLFQDGINSIVLTKDSESLIEKEELEKEYDLVMDVFPPHRKESDWYNHRDMVSETILMAGEQYYEVFNTLPDEFKKPRLNPWWPKGKLKERTIAIHTTAGYSKDYNRSPSFTWWNELLEELNKNYDILQFGHPLDSGFDLDIKRCNEFSLFEQVQMASECEYYIGTDSGFSLIMGALGVRQISLLTDWLYNHHNNPLALAAINCENKATNLFAPGGCDNIDINRVLQVLIKT